MTSGAIWDPQQVSDLEFMRLFEQSGIPEWLRKRRAMGIAPGTPRSLRSHKCKCGARLTKKKYKHCRRCYEEQRARLNLPCIDCGGLTSRHQVSRCKPCFDESRRAV